MTPRLSPRLAVAALAAGVALAVLVTHWPALSAQALSFDDTEYLLENYPVRQPSWDGAWRFLTEVSTPSTVQGYYHPLSMISLMMDSALGGSPAHLEPYHRTSLALHVSNTVLIIILLYLIFGNAWAAAATGLIFGLHPMTVENIPWIAERKTVLAAFFALASLICYVQYTKQLSLWWYTCCAATYILALLSKPTCTPLPMMMLIMDYWPLRRLSRRAALEKVPLLALGAGSAIITVLSQRGTFGAMLPTEYAEPLRVPLVLCHNTIFYLQNITCPIHLSFYYPFPKLLTLANHAVLAGAVGTPILLLLLGISLRWTRALATGWLIFFVGLLPTMGIVGFTSAIAADRFAYLPAVGLLLVLSWCIAQLWRLAGARLSRKALLVIVPVAISIMECVLTRGYIAQWKGTLTLCQYMVRMSLEAAVPENSLANALYEQGQVQDAIAHFEKSLTADPGYAYTHYNLANALAKIGRRQDAIYHYNEAIRLHPRYPQAEVNLGAVLLELGQPGEAIDHLETGLRLREGSPTAHVNLSLALLQVGRYDEALLQARSALELNPDLHAAHRLSALSLLNLGRKAETLKELDILLQEQRTDPETRAFVEKVKSDLR